MPQRGSRRTPDFGSLYDSGMLPQWGYGEYNPSNPRGTNVRELPTPTGVQSHFQEPDDGYGRDALDYWSDPSSHLDQAPYPPVAQAPHTSNVPAPYYPSSQGSHHPFGQTPYTAIPPAPYYPRGQGSHHPFGQAKPIPYEADYAFSRIGGDHSKTTIICGKCDEEIANSYKGSYEPPRWEGDKHAGQDEAGNSYTTFHDSETAKEVVRVYSDGLGFPCSWHGGRKVHQIIDKHSRKSPGKSGHGGKGSSRR